MDPAAASPVFEAALRVATNPANELAAAAVRARDATGLAAGKLEFIVVAVPSGKAIVALEPVRKAALDAVNAA
jgi:hypothetical protein